MIDPLVSGIYAGDMYQLSAAACFPKLKEMEKKQGSLMRALLKNPPQKPITYSFQEGMATLTHSLRYQIGATYVGDCHVTQINKAPSSFTIQALHRNAKTTWEASHIVMAIPAFEAGKLLQVISPNIAEELLKIRYAPMIVVAMAYDIDLPENCKGFGFLIPRKETPGSQPIPRRDLR